MSTYLNTVLGASVDVIIEVEAGSVVVEYLSQVSRISFRVSNTFLRRVTHDVTVFGASVLTIVVVKSLVMLVVM